MCIVSIITSITLFPGCTPGSSLNILHNITYSINEFIHDILSSEDMHSRIQSLYKESLTGSLQTNVCVSPCVCVCFCPQQVSVAVLTQHAAVLCPVAPS